MSVLKKHRMMRVKRRGQYWLRGTVETGVDVVKFDGSGAECTAILPSLMPHFSCGLLLYVEL